jgi:hypothetical protein
MLRPLSSLLILASIASPQTTHLVGPGGFADLNLALAAATDGDILLVQPGSYPTFLTTLGVTIRALVPGTVTLLPGLGTIFNLQPGKSAHVLGVNTSALFVTGGSISLDQCTIAGTPTGFGGLFAQDCTLHLQSCTVRGLPAFGGPPPGALRAFNSVVTGVDCTIEGVTALGTWGYPGAAVEVQNTELRLASSIVRGGNGLFSPVAYAVSADAASSVWLSDCTLSTTLTSCPVDATSGRLARCTLTPNCSALPSGEGLGARRTSPLQNGAPFSVEFRDEPNRAVVVWAAFELQTTSSPLLEQSALLAQASAFPLATVVTDALGIAGASWPIPAGSMFVDRTLWLQAAAGISLPVQTSVVVGGVVR